MASVNRDIAKILGRTEAANTDNVALGSGSGLTVYATPDLLPTSGLTAGDQAYVTSNNRIYISNGSGWYNVALINSTPTFTSGPDAAYALATDLTPTVITLVAQDSDGQSVTYSATPSGMDGIATLSQDSSVFTVTPLHDSAGGAGSFTITFQATDGIGIASGVSTFSLTFTPNWSSFNTTVDITTKETNNYSHDFSIGVTSTGETVAFSNVSSMPGYVYTMTRTGNTWSNKTTAATGAAPYQFGRSVDISPNDKYICVSDPVDNKLHLYKKGATWASATKVNGGSAIISSNSSSYGSSDIQFGGTSDEYLVIGNRYSSTDGLSNNGNVHAYWINPSNDSVTLIGTLKSTVTGSNRFLGAGVGISEDGTTVVGSGNVYEELMIFDSTGNGSGRVYSQTQRITAPTVGKGFGYDCDISGNKSRIVVGGNAGGGTCCVFYHNGSSWALETELSLPASSAAFGYHVKLNHNGDILFVSDPFKSSGFIYVYSRSGSTWSLVNSITPSSGTYLGMAMDINRAGDMVMSTIYHSGSTEDRLAYYYV